MLEGGGKEIGPAWQAQPPARPRILAAAHAVAVLAKFFGKFTILRSKARSAELLNNLQGGNVSLYG
jgi:hypothetical protein